MQVKTFEATKMKDAVRAVKSELGNDAVILSTREIAGKGPGGSAIIEVTAAAPVEQKSFGASASKRNDAPGLFDSAVAHEMRDRFSRLHEYVASQKQVSTIDATLSDIRFLLNEIFSDRHDRDELSLPEAVLPITKRLRSMEVASPIIAELADHLRSILAKESANKKVSLIDEAMRWMLRRVRVMPHWGQVVGVSQIHALVGTSGSGKSTVAAKLAHYFKKKMKLSCAIISIDRGRIAASDQLRTLCKIIDVPFVTIGDASSIAQSVRSLGAPSLVIIDTPSYNPRGSAELPDLEVLKSNLPASQFHLVLPATEREDQMTASVRHFGQVGLSSLLFSKLDEAWVYGSLFNLSMRWSLPLSAFSLGPVVPDDIEWSSRERVIERIFGST